MRRSENLVPTYRPENRRRAITAALALAALAAPAASPGAAADDDASATVPRIDTAVLPRCSASFSFLRSLPVETGREPLAFARLSVDLPKGARARWSIRSHDPFGYPPFVPMAAAMDVAPPDGARPLRAMAPSFGARLRGAFTVRRGGAHVIEVGLRSRRARGAWIPIALFGATASNEKPTAEIDLHAAPPPVLRGRATTARSFEFPAFARDAARVVVRIGRRTPAPFPAFHVRVEDAAGAVLAREPVEVEDARSPAGAVLETPPFPATGTWRVAVETPGDALRVSLRVEAIAAPEELDDIFDVDGFTRLFGRAVGAEGATFECPPVAAADAVGNDPAGVRVEVPPGAFAADSIVRVRGTGSFYLPLETASRPAGPAVSVQILPRAAEEDLLVSVPSVRAWSAGEATGATVERTGTPVAGEEIEGGRLRRIALPAGASAWSLRAADAAQSWEQLDAFEAEPGAAFRLVKDRGRVRGASVGGLWFELDPDTLRFRFAGAIPLAGHVAQDADGSVVGAADALLRLEGHVLSTIGGTGTAGFPPDVVGIPDVQPLAFADWGTVLGFEPDGGAGRFLLTTWDAGSPRIRLLDTAAQTSTLVAGHPLWTTPLTTDAVRGPLAQGARGVAVETYSYCGADETGRILAVADGLPLRLDPSTGSAELLADAGTLRFFGGARLARHARFRLGWTHLSTAGPDRFVVTSPEGWMAWIDLAADRYLERRLEPPGFVVNGIDAAWDVRHGLLALSPVTGDDGEPLLGLWRLR